MMVVKRVEHINGSHESAPLVGGYNPYSIMDACGISNASFFPMEEDPLIWTPPQPEDTEIVSYRISNLSDNTELSLASHGSNSEFFEDHFIHRNVSDNMTLLLSNVSESVERNLIECLPVPISESVSSFYGFKNEKSGSEFPSDLTQVTEIVIDDNTMKVKLQNKNHVESLLDSESILVLTSIHNVTKQAACEQSKLSLIKFYADFDATLGQYLQDILLSQKYTCSSCGELSEAHIYRYTHQNGTLAAIVKQLPKGSVLPGEAEGKIWVWNRCLKCNHHKGVSKAGRRVVMSFAASQLSFGKFLYLSFSNHLETNRLLRCGHLLHKDCLQFFGLGSKVAMFRYSPIEIYTACKPQLWLESYNQNKQLGEMKEAKEVLKMGELLFEEVTKILKKLKSHSACSIQKQPDKLSGMMEHIDEVENMLKQDKTVFESSLLKAVNQGAKQGKNVNENLDFSWLLKELHFMLYVWDCRLHVLSQDAGYISIKLGSANQEILEIDLKNKPSTVSDELAPSSSNTCFNVYKEVSVPILDHIQQEKFQSVAIVPLSNAEEATDSEPIPSSNEKSLHSDNPGHWIWTPFSEMQKDFKKDINGSSLHKFQLHFAENEVSGVIASALVSYSDRYGPVDIIFDKEVIGKLDQTFNISKSAYPASLEPDEFSVYPLVYQLIISDNLHPEISLDHYKIAGRCKYTVICIYAKEFRSLRNQWFLSEQAYISSLSCSKKWDAQGGKSRVYFAKTIDEKLILKQLKKAELDSFLNFGPQYFNYLSLSAASGNQTCLAKIFGIYQVRQVINGKEVKTDLIMVMENLFSGRNITRKYDLKGATFSRYISDANDRDIVLLDENFINDMCISPMYFKETSKYLMERSIRNDTSFLASINVMDYSLLVGVDRESRELVFGIIDYVRQYTWDKQLETWVKSSLIVPKNALPTVVSPKEYRKRFLKFLSKHILAVPDAWSCR